MWTAHYGRCAGIIAVLVNVGLQQPLVLVARLAAATSVAVFMVVFVEWLKNTVNICYATLVQVTYAQIQKITTPHLEAVMLWGAFAA